MGVPQREYRLRAVQLPIGSRRILSLVEVPLSSLCPLNLPATNSITLGAVTMVKPVVGSRVGPELKRESAEADASLSSILR